MKLVSILALGTVLALATPVAAQQQAAGAQAAAPAWTPTLSREFRAVAAPVAEAATAQNWAAAKAGLATAAPVATTPDEKYVLGQLQLQIAQGENNEADQLAALRTLVGAGIDPEGRIAQYRFFLGQAAYRGNDFPNAIQQLTAAEQAGHRDPNLHLTLAESYFRTNQLAPGLAEVEKAIALERAAGRTPPAQWYGRAVTVAYQARNMPEVAKWTQAQVDAYPSPENWRTVLAIWEQDKTLDNQVALDLHRLRRATGALTSERDYFTYAQAAYDRGLFGEAKAVIDEGEAANKLERTTPAFSQLYTASNGRIAADRREATAAEGRIAAGDGPLAFDTANVMLGYGEDAKAAQLYRTAIEKGGIDASTANMRLGIALARSGQADAAKQAFAQVTGPRAELARFWTVWLDQRA